MLLGLLELLRHYSMHCNSFSLYNVAKLSSNKTGENGVQVETENEKFIVMCPEFGHFTLLFGRVRQRNVPKFKMHVRSDCLCSLSLLFCDVVVQLPSQLSLFYFLTKASLKS